MRKSAYAFLLILSGMTFQTSAQIDVTGNQTSIGVGPGITMFFGDVGSLKDDISKFSQIKLGYQVSLEQRVGDLFAFSFSGLFGRLGESDRSKAINRNFESKIMQADLNLVFHFDNGIIMERSAQVAPYVTAGFGYLKFDPYADLLDANGKNYFYWSDGSIRDKSQADTNKKSAQIIKRDYVYETQLTDNTENYARNTFAIPLGFGFKMKLINSLDLNLGGTYYMTFSDFVDNLKDGKNDSYIYSYFSLQYNFGYKTTTEPVKESPRYEKVDFTSIDKLDADGDGVVDIDDRCPGTPSGIKTDAKGCPPDLDGDGVSDYMDEELNTRKGAIVDEKGVTQSDEILAKKQAEYDSLATERSNVFNENPSMRYLRQLDVQASQKIASGEKVVSSIPDELKSADKNNDGYISSEEIIAAIDSFFDGSSDFTAEKLNRLIDFFFEQ